jgi:hypothetical protein
MLENAVPGCPFAPGAKQTSATATIDKKRQPGGKERQRKHRPLIFVLISDRRRALFPRARRAQ